MVKIFATGATGYVGGDALQVIVPAHPEYEITCLVRDEKKGKLVQERWPNVKLVYGDLDNSEVLQREAAAADIVCHWAHSDHVGAVEAIVEGMRQNQASEPRFLIHTSGTGILLYDHMQKGLEYGAPSDKIFNDWDGVKEVTTLPDEAIHRPVDRLVLEAENIDANIKGAVVAPPCIYGPGRGPVNQRSIQIPDLIKGTLTKGHGIQILAGDARWNTVHVQDLSELFLLLVEEAAKGGGKATWGAENDGYYFAENDDLRWGDASKWVADAAYKHKLIKSDEVVSLKKDEADFGFNPWGAMIWGVNSRSKAERAYKLLNWKPEAKSVKEEMENAVLVEAKAMGLIA